MLSQQHKPLLFLTVTFFRFCLLGKQNVHIINIVLNSSKLKNPDFTQITKKKAHQKKKLLANDFYVRCLKIAEKLI